MKNTLVAILLCLCCACIAFTGGLFLGRNNGHDPIQLGTVPAAPANTAPPPTQQTQQTQPLWPLNINTADAQQLQALPGIGEALAQRILDYREENGPFTDVAQLSQVSGIGTKKLEAIIDYITVGG